MNKLLKFTAIATLALLPTSASQLTSASKTQTREAIASPVSVLQQPRNAAMQRQDTDEATIRQLTEQWFEAWSFREGQFTGEQLRPLYAQGDGEILVFDDFKGSVVVIRSFRDYLNTWVPVMKDFSCWVIEPEGEVAVTVDGDLAVSTFTWLGTGQLQNGEPVKMRQHGTLVWSRRAGTWKIVHEHLTVGNPPQ